MSRRKSDGQINKTSVRSFRREQLKANGVLPTYRFRSVRMPNKRRQAQRDACRQQIDLEQTANDNS